VEPQILGVGKTVVAQASSPTVVGEKVAGCWQILVGKTVVEEIVVETVVGQKVVGQKVVGAGEQTGGEQTVVVVGDIAVVAAIVG